uniref:Xaa-Pro dipeptidase n=1 Tax=Nelumbo nucifera TaxID=4432 RepID=A0A822XKK4_NELNU|nr:TPA_asm: hypothetical protein HUJ06_023577 [Nelumbo nucifera]
MASYGPPDVAMELHALNRAKLVHSFRQYLKASSLPLYGFILLQGGEEHTRNCSDHVPLFRQESYFAYLFGVREPGFYGAIDVSTGKSILFAPRLTEDYAIWSGKIKPLSSFKERYMVSMVCYTGEIGQVLKSHYRGPAKPLLYLLYGLNTDSNRFSKPAEFEGIDEFDTDSTTLHPILTENRVFKSELELGLIRYANDISSAAHIEVMQKTKVGMKEYRLEMIFLHHIYMHGGCRQCSYTCICATGENSSIIHYGHAAAPNDRTLEDGDMALMDMGAEYHFYASDISCSLVGRSDSSDNSDGLTCLCCTEPEFRQLAGGRVLVILESELEVIRLVGKSPFRLGGRTLTLFRWDPGLEKEKAVWGTQRSRIQVFGLPLHAWSLEMFRELGNAVGGCFAGVAEDNLCWTDLEAMRFLIRWTAMKEEENNWDSNPQPYTMSISGRKSYPAPTCETGVGVRVGVSSGAGFERFSPSGNTIKGGEIERNGGFEREGLVQRKREGRLCRCRCL